MPHSLCVVSDVVGKLTADTSFSSQRMHNTQTHAISA